MWSAQPRSLTQSAREAKRLQQRAASLKKPRAILHLEKLLAHVSNTWLGSSLHMNARIKNRLSICREKPRQISKRLKSLNWLAMAIIWAGLPAHARVFYVDVDEGSDSNPGTSTNSAWAHLPGTVGFSVPGWTRIDGGDTILVKGGTTNYVRVTFDTAYYSGKTVFDSIVIQSGHLAGWGSGRAIFDGQNTRTGGFLINGNGITVDGFEIREIKAGANPPIDERTGSCCIGILQANFVTVKRCWLHNAYSRGPSTDVGHGIEMSGGTNFIFTQNQIGPTIQMKGIEPYRASFGVISNNFFSGVYEHCLSMNTSSNWDLCNNLIRHDPPYGPEPSWAISVAGCHNLDVWNNVIFRTLPVIEAPPLYFGLAIGMYGNNSSNRFACNTIAFFNDTANGGSHQTAISIERGPNVNIASGFYNNLVYSNYNNLGPVAYCVSPDITTLNEVMYCDFFAASSNETVMSFEVNGSDELRTVANFAPSCGKYTHNVQVDPGFTSGVMPSGLDSNGHPNSPFFQLSTNSPPAVTATYNELLGDPVHGYDHSVDKFSLDIVGRRRTAWSMGAYEAVTGIAPRPRPPTGLRIIAGP